MGTDQQTGRGSSVSYDNGVNWTMLDTSGSGTLYGYNLIEFLDGTTGWAGGLYYNNNNGIFKWSGGTVGIKENQSAEGFIAYPNPTKNILTLTTDKVLSGNITVSITDITGKVCALKTYPGKLNEIRMDLTALPSGVYLVHVVSDSANMVKRILKE